jgi:hypothetical protein
MAPKSSKYRQNNKMLNNYKILDHQAASIIHYLNFNWNFNWNLENLGPDAAPRQLVLMLLSLKNTNSNHIAEDTESLQRIRISRYSSRNIWPYRLDVGKKMGFSAENHLGTETYRKSPNMSNLVHNNWSYA